MLLTLDRQPSWRETTLGVLWVDERVQCYTLEDQVRPAGDQVAGHTAIPAGRYQVLVTWSPHFKRPLPLLLDVPGFEGIRIHPGNSATDTEGCILVGEAVADAGHILRSAAAFEGLFPLIERGVTDADGCWIEVVDPGGGEA